jgi:hypothetical protein
MSHQQGYVHMKTILIIKYNSLQRPYTRNQKLIFGRMNCFEEHNIKLLCFFYTEAKHCEML